ncbi:MAG: 50S ribosomal protein L15 [Croceibacterium sp.]
MKLNDIRDNAGARKERMRVGRGIGSGKGKTAGRGQKGQKSRSGVAVKGFEGGQMPLHMRLPKRGFNNPFGKDYAEVNLGQLQKLVDEGKLDAKAVIDQAALQAAGVARGGKHGVRLLGKGVVTSALKFTVAGVSKGAREAIEKAGGSVDVIVVKPAAEKAAEKKAAGAAARKTTAAARAPKKGAKAPAAE